jgi:predicted PurR-regulated permease PerM
MVNEEGAFHRYAAIAIFVALIVVSYFVIRPFFLSLFLSALMAYTIFPIYKWLVKKTKRKTLSSFLLTLAVLLLIVIPASWLINTIVKESYVIYLIAKQRLATGLFHGCTAQICDTLTSYLQSPDVILYIERAINAVTQYFISKGSAILFVIPTLLINLFVFHFTLFYLLKDGENFVHRLGYYLSVQKKKYAQIVYRLREVTFGVVYGYLLVALLQGTLGAIGFWIVGLPSPVFWGVIMAILALFPYLGTAIIWGPAAAIMIISGLGQNSTIIVAKGIGLIVYSSLLVSGIDNLIRPKIIGDKAKIHPAIILVGILGGILFFGPFGVILGPMLLSLTSIIFEVYLGKKPTKHQVKKVLKHPKEIK